METNSYRDFYVIDIKENRRTMLIDAPYSDGRDIWRGIGIPENPVYFHYYTGGTKLDDCLHEPAGAWLWSDRLVVALNDAKITGFKLYPVILEDKQKKEVHGYSGAAIVGRAGKVDLKKSEIVEEQPEPYPKKIKRLKGMYFGLDEWDGSDVFMEKDIWQSFCTQKFVDVVSRIKGHNFEFIPVSEYRLSTSHLDHQLEEEKKESGEVN